MKPIIFISVLLLTLPACSKSPQLTQNQTHTQVLDSEKAEVMLSDADLDDLNIWYSIVGFRVGDYVLRDGENAQEKTRKIRESAERGDIDAQNKLGFVYLSGDGIPQDRVKAIHWFRKAAENGSAEAQLNLGGMYVAGREVTQDYAQAAYWYQKAAEQGNADGQMKLCLSYALGKGVSRDYVIAYAWCNLGISRMTNNDWRMSSMKIRNTISRILSDTELAEAQRLSGNWRESQPIQRDAP